MKRKELFFLIIILLLPIIIFWKFFFLGLYPFPGDYLIAWHEPWKTDNVVNGTILIPHKPVAEDIFRQIYPFKQLAVDFIKKGQLPLWNPYNGAGMPLFATINIGFLDPFNFLFFIFDSKFAWSLYITIQSGLIAIFTYLYCRKLQLGNYASLFSSIAFTLSGFVITRLIFGMYGLAIASLPALLLLIESYIQNPKSKTIFLLPLIIAILIFSTQPQISIYILLFTFLYTISRLITKYKKKNILRKMLTPISLFTLGIGVAGVQLLPTFELYKHTQINTSSSSFIIEKFLLPPWHFISILIPNYFGNVATYNYWGSGDYIQTITAIGLIPCLFVVLAIGKRLKNVQDVRKFYWIAIAITILLSLDWITSRFILSLPIPIFSTGAPSRILFLTTFSITILSGIGFQKIMNSKISKSILSKYILFAFIALTILVFSFILFKTNPICETGIIANCRTVALRNTILEIFFFSTFSLFFFTLLFSSKIKVRLGSTIAIIIIVSIIGLYNSNKFLPFSDKETIFPQNNLIDAMQNKTTDARVFGLGDANIPMNFATQFRTYDPQYYHPLYIVRYRQLLDYANTGTYNTELLRGSAEINTDASTSGKLKERRNRLFELLSIKYLTFNKNNVPISDDKIVIWEDNKKYIEKIPTLQRGYIVNKYEIKKTDMDILTTLFDQSFDPYTNVVIEQDLPYISNDVESKGTVKIKKYSANEVIFNTNTTTASLFVLTDNYYPGWKAYIDEKETKTYRANYTFRAIELPPGEHTVKFLYDPVSLRVGIYISLISLLILSVMFKVRKKL